MEDKVKRLSKGRLEVMRPKTPKEFQEKYKKLKTDDLIGIGTVPESEKPFNPVKAVEDVRIVKEMNIK
ncbi:MAG: C1 family peptidase [Methanobrevibacter sp.]|jgi:aminopeptidase C|nr:C1 family peptidase [Methanobrevibacter sp.]